MAKQPMILVLVAIIALMWFVVSSVNGFQDSAPNTQFTRWEALLQPGKTIEIRLSPLGMRTVTVEQWNAKLGILKAKTQDGVETELHLEIYDSSWEAFWRAKGTATPLVFSRIK